MRCRKDLGVWRSTAPGLKAPFSSSDPRHSERELVASATRPRDKVSRLLAHSANIVLKVQTLNSGAPSEAEVELGEGVGSLPLSFPLASLG